MEFQITPYEGVGPVHLGMRRVDVRAALGPNVTPFLRGPFATRETDAFDDVGVYVEYDEAEKCESITLCLSAQAIYRNEPLIGRNIDEVKRNWQQIDAKLEDDGSSIISREIGLAAYGEDEIIKAVTLFVRGYYEANDQ